MNEEYVSPDLTHFVGGGSRCADDDARYDLLSLILRTGELKNPAPPAGTSGFTVVRVGKGLNGQFALRDGPISGDALYFASTVCFCDIPLPALSIHMAKYSSFGVAFPKPFLIARGARPVMYVPKGTRPFMLPPVNESLADRFDAMVPRLIRGHRTAIARALQRRPALAKVKAGHLTREQQDFMQFTEELPFLLCEVFAFIKFFDETTADRDPANYYMEREWRVLTNLHFSANDVTRIIVGNDGYRQRLEEDFPEYVGKTYSPGTC